MTFGRSQGLAAAPPATASRGFGGGRSRGRASGVGGRKAQPDMSIGAQAPVVGGQREASMSRGIQADTAEDSLAQESLVAESPTAETINAEQPREDLTRSETIDLDRIWRTLDRSLLMLALGAKPQEIKALPKTGVDGRSFIFEGTVEVTVLWDSGCDESEARAAMAAAGLSIQGAAEAGSIVVGRIDIAKLLTLAQTTCVRRLVPTSAR